MYFKSTNKTAELSPEELMNFVHPVCEIGENNLPVRHVGTCFRISSAGLYLTAGHIFPHHIDFRNEFKKPDILRNPKNLKFDPNRNRFCIFRRLSSTEPDKEISEIISINEIWFLYRTDAAILYIPHGAKETWSVGDPLLIDSAFPTDVIHAGYPGQSNSIDQLENGLQASFNVETTNARMDRPFPNGRDRGLANFSCFSTNANLQGGFSGGPVLLSGMRFVIGINSISDGEGCNSIVVPVPELLDIPIGIPALSSWCPNHVKPEEWRPTLRQFAKLKKVGLLTVRASYEKRRQED